MTVEDAGSKSGHDPDHLERLLREVQADPIAAAAYEDAQDRAVLVAALVQSRSRSGLTQRRLADLVDTTQSAVSDLEGGRVDPRLSTLQRYARATGSTIKVLLDGVEVEAPSAAKRDDLDDEPDDLDQLLEEVEADPVAHAAQDDAQHRAAVIAALRRSRLRTGLTQRRLAEFMDATQSALSDIESGRIDPRLSTLQRYARGTGRTLSAFVDQPETVSRDIVARLAPNVANHGPDPVLADGVRLAANFSIEDVLRPLVLEKSAPGLAWYRLVGQTRVSRPTKSRTVQNLTRRGWLTAVEGDAGGAKLALNEQAAFFIGISIRSDHVRGTVTNLRLVGEHAPEIYSIPLSAAAPDHVVDNIVRLTEHLSSTSVGEIMGVGVELSGPVNGDTGTVLFAPDLQPLTDAPWTGFPLEAEIQDRTGLRTVVQNDARALATRESLLQGATGGLLVVNVSESTRGIGAGLVFNGGIIQGAAGEGGELGHITVDPDGTLCMRCAGGRRGCLETEASGAAIARKIGVRSLTEAAVLVEDGNHQAARIFYEAGMLLGHVLGDVVTLLNPAQLILYGPSELVDDREMAAVQFTSGISSGLSERSLGKAAAPRFVVIKEQTGPLAAASVAVNQFLSSPLDWAPEMIAATSVFHAG